MGQLLMIGTLVATLTASCGVGDDETGPTASATLTPRAQGSTVNGTASFVTIGSKVRMTLNVTGASPGQHGVHLHAMPSCEADGQGVAAGAAGGHWNPDSAPHAFPDATSHHLGDCGNITVQADGTGQLIFEGEWTIGTGQANDIIDKPVIVHAMPDDGTTQMPPGNAGARQACGLISNSTSK